MSTKPHVARPVPLLFKNSIAGAVARAIEHHPGQDFENVFAIAAVYAPVHVVRTRVDHYSTACRAGKVDRERMRACFEASRQGVAPADREALL